MHLLTTPFHIPAKKQVKSWVNLVFYLVWEQNMRFPWQTSFNQHQTLPGRLGSDKGEKHNSRRYFYTVSTL